jgi:hypothetical protein
VSVTSVTTQGAGPRGALQSVWPRRRPGWGPLFVDEHIARDASGCGPVVHGEGVFKLTFEHGVASTPQAIVTGIDFPLGITVCDPTHHVCPTPP